MESRSTRQEAQDGLRIFAYGFDAAGFEIPGQPLRLRKAGRVEFISFNHSMSLDCADGLIIPQGIFEEIEVVPAYMHTYTSVKTSESLLLDRERQVLNMLNEGKWVCFLIGKIVDKVLQDRRWENIADTDLCKRLLNTLRIDRQTVDGVSQLDAKRSEFASYIREYGVAKTVLKLPHPRDFEERVLVKAGGFIVGVEVSAQVFFLPFHTVKRDATTLASVVRTVTQAVVDYRQKRLQETPAWVNEFRFSSKKKLEARVDSLLEETRKLQNELQLLREHKAILTTSGDILKDRLVKVLEGFFQVKVDAIDELREDAKVLNEDASVLALIEVKGTKKGITREQINQVDSHRERNELASNIPGVLFINNEMSVQGIDRRLKTVVPGEHIKHAKNLNILIVRTVDLLFLMRHLEDHTDRKGEIIKLLSSGGGWLRADSEGYEIVSR